MFIFRKILLDDLENPSRLILKGQLKKYINFVLTIGITRAIFIFCVSGVIFDYLVRNFPDDIYSRTFVSILFTLYFLSELIEVYSKIIQATSTVKDEIKNEDEASYYIRNMEEE